MIVNVMAFCALMLCLCFILELFWRWLERRRIMEMTHMDWEAMLTEKEHDDE